MILANFILFCYLLLVIILWAHYGLLSAFLHLLVTISCTALTLALWEPLVLGVLIDRMPYYAWGVGLLGPFILIVVGARAIQDRLVPTNMRFENLTSMIGGGLCGLGTGILTSGILVIGIGLLPVGKSMIGYEPMVLSGNGVIQGQVGDGLLLPVDKYAAQFFSRLSRGIFYPHGNRPLAMYQPALDSRAILNRLRPDPDSSFIAHPKGVRIERVAYYHPRDLEEIIEDPNEKTGSLLLVGTVWDAVTGPGTYDTEGGLRVAPSQVRLATTENFTALTPLTLHAPLGVVIPGSTPEADVTRFDDDRAVAYSRVRSGARLIWVFRINENVADADKFIFIRMLRLPLPKVNSEAARPYQQFVGDFFRPPPVETLVPEVTSSEGEGPAIASHTGGPADHGGGKADKVEFTDKLPYAVSMHNVLQHQLREAGIFSGKAEVQYPIGLSKHTQVRHIYTVPGEYMIRVHVGKDPAQSMYGQIRQMGHRLATFFIQDSLGNPHHAIGYVWRKKETGAQYIQIDRLGSLRRVEQLPLSEMRREDELYIYFSIPHGVSVSKMVIGNSEQTITGGEAP